MKELVQKGYRTRTAVSTASIDHLSSSLDVQMSPFLLQLLAVEFKMSLPVWSTADFSILVGSGYNEITQEIVRSNYIYTKPGGKVDHQGSGKTFRYEGQSAKLDQQQDQMRAHMDLASTKGNAGGRFSASKETSDERACSNKCAFYDTVLFTQEAQNLDEWPASPRFKEVVGNLPTTFEKDNPKNRETWKDFFETYGHSVITCLSFGGSAQVALTADSYSHGDREAAQTLSLMTFMNYLRSGAVAEASSTVGNEDEQSHFQVSYIGGHTKDHVMMDKPGKTPESWVEQIGSDARWQESVKQYPAPLLHRKVDRMRIHKVVETIKKTKVVACKEALDYFLKKKSGESNLKTEEIKPRGVQLFSIALFLLLPFCSSICAWFFFQSTVINTMLKYEEI